MCVIYVLGFEHRLPSVCACVHLCVHVYVCVHLCVHVCACVYVCVQVLKSVQSLQTIIERKAMEKLKYERGHKSDQVVNKNGK